MIQRKAKLPMFSKKEIMSIYWYVIDYYWGVYIREVIIFVDSVCFPAWMKKKWIILNDFTFLIGIIWMSSLKNRENWFRFKGNWSHFQFLWYDSPNLRSHSWWRYDSIYFGKLSLKSEANRLIEYFFIWIKSFIHAYQIEFVI